MKLKARFVRAVLRWFGVEQALKTDALNFRLQATVNRNQEETNQKLRHLLETLRSALPNNGDIELRPCQLCGGVFWTNHPSVTIFTRETPEGVERAVICRWDKAEFERRNTVRKKRS